MKQKPFIIAEMSGNHNQSLENALAIVESAANAGCSALKLQTYTPDTMTLDCNSPDFIINDPKSLWYKRNLYDLYREAMTPWEWHKPIFDKCKQMGLLPFSTPFDSTAVDFLEKLDCPIYKIASFENTDIPLIKKVASTGKPVIMSTGMASFEELEESVNCLKENGCNDITLLKCTSSYPASPETCNLLTIPDMQKRFGVDIGLSDHTLGIGVSVTSIALGVTVIEKHFTLSRADGGVDSAFSIEPEEMKKLVDEVNIAWLALGKISYGISSDSEEKSKKFRRSVYASENIKKNQKFTSVNIRVIRPGFGIAPKYYDEIIGKKATENILKGTPLNWSLIK